MLNLINKNKLPIFIFFFLIFLTILFLPTEKVLAQAYTGDNGGLVPCGNGNNPANACTLCHLIVGFFNIFSWFKTILITIAAVGIFISGLMYIVSSGDEGAITKAKEFLKASIIGFTVVLSSWLIVNVTMWVLSAQDLGIGKTNWYTFECSTTPSTPSTGAITIPTATPATPPATTLPTGTLTDSVARQRLTSAGITISSSGNCSDQNNPNCTSLQGIPERTITNLINIRTTCNLPMTITAGTETGHRSHGTGLTPVDLHWNTALASCMVNNASTFNINAICTAPQDSQYRINCNYNEPNQHIHVSFQ